jgi:hypothetical protein
MAVSLFCVVFSSVYGMYSHGVHSNYMTLMFTYPFFGGTLPCLLIAFISKAKMPERFVVNIYNSGIAALTVGSMLKGIFDIAGTSSPYQPFFVIVGAGLATVAIACYLVAQFKNQPSQKP